MTDAREVEARMRAEIDDMLGEVRDNIKVMGRDRAMDSLHEVIQLLIRLSPASVSMMMTIITTWLAEATATTLTPEIVPVEPGQPEVRFLELGESWFSEVQESAVAMMSGMSKEITDELARDKTELQVAMEITAVNINGASGMDQVTNALSDSATIAFVLVEYAKLKNRLDMLELEIQVNGN
jgi:hypothetical protein